MTSSTFADILTGPITPVHTLAISGEEVGAIMMVGMLVIAFVSIVAAYVHKIVRARAFEASRREIAAYVAEGSISADDAQKLLAAVPTPGKGMDCA